MLHYKVYIIYLIMQQAVYLTGYGKKNWGKGAAFCSFFSDKLLFNPSSENPKSWLNYFSTNNYFKFSGNTTMKGVNFVKIRKIPERINSLRSDNISKFGRHYSEMQGTH